MNPYIDYYKHQIGKGIMGFKGMKRQKGSGILLNLLTKSIVPLVSSTIKSIDPGKLVKMAGNFLGSPGLRPGLPIADDIARIGATAAGSLINSLQGGKGRKYKRRRHCRKKSVAKKRCTRKRRKCVAKPKKRITKKKIKRRRTLKKKYPNKRSSRKRLAKRRSTKKRATAKRYKKKLRRKPFPDIF